MEHLFLRLPFRDRRILSIFFLLLLSFVFLLPTCASENEEKSSDSTTTQARRWGLSMLANPGGVMATNEDQKQYIKKKFTQSFSFEMQRSALPEDNSAFDEDFGYPTLGIGLKYSMNHNVSMHKDGDRDWGEAEEVDYNTRLGNTLTVYGTFVRPLLRMKRWEADYTLNLGLGYSHSKYNRHNAIDNELIGARWLIFFGAGFHATWHLHRDWGMRFGLDYWHLSNGGMSRPNKGVNVFGPTIGFVYTPYYTATLSPKQRRPEDNRYVYIEVTGGVGGKSLYEEWKKTQFETPKDHPDYRKDHFSIYPAFSLQADMMCRYARRWASGMGIDMFYGTYYKRLRTLDELDNLKASHSPFSLGIAAKHEIYYHNFSFAVAVGYYIYREMGFKAYLNDAPYYERVGLHYTFPRLNNLRLGINVKAHKGKADLTEIVFGMPIIIKRLK